jgi:hypothetical protein
MTTALAGPVATWWRWRLARRRVADGAAFSEQTATSRRPGPVLRRRGADPEAAERAYRFTAAVAEREAARAAFRRRWGGYVCHMPNEPYDVD